MKTILSVILIFFSFSSFSQIKFEKEKDDFTGASSVNTHYTFIDKIRQSENKSEQKKYNQIGNRLALSMKYQKTDQQEVYWVNLILNKVDLGCLSKYDGKMLVLLEDGTSLEFHQVSQTDCSSDYSKVSYSLISKEGFESLDDEGYLNKKLREFKEKSIKKIRVHGTKYYADFDISEEKKFILADNVNTIESNK